MKGSIQQNVEDWRSLVQDAPNPFKTPDAFGAAGYALSEAGEAWDAMLRVIRSGDLRRRSDGEVEPLDKELAQLAFMLCTTATLLDVELPDHDSEISDDPILDMLLVMGNVNELVICIHGGNCQEWAGGILIDAWNCLGPLANRLCVDLNSEIDTWMATIYEKAWGYGYAKQS